MAETDVLNDMPVGASDKQRDFYSRALTAYRGGALKRGARGKTVRALQLFLRDQGHDIKADGILGPETQKALKAWQADEGLASDGIAGQREVFTRIRETVAPRPRTRPEPPPPPSPIDSVPPGVGINDAAFEASKQDLSAAAAATTAAPGIIDDGYPVGAGGARPDPTRRPIERPMPGPFPSRMEVAGALPAAPPVPPGPYDDGSRQFDIPGARTRMAEEPIPVPPPPPEYPIGNLNYSVPPFSGPPEADPAFDRGRMDDAMGMEPQMVMPQTADQIGALPQDYDPQTLAIMFQRIMQGTLPRENGLTDTGVIPIPADDNTALSFDSMPGSNEYRMQNASLSPRDHEALMRAMMAQTGGY